MAYHRPEDIDPKARELIRHKVRRLAERGIIPRCDCEDVGQELALHVFLAGRKYDAAKATQETYYSHVVNRRAQDIADYYCAALRDRRRVKPMDERFELEARQGPDLTYQVRIEVEEVLDLLPADLLPLASLLGEQSLVEAGRSLGLTRQQARTRKAAIAAVFEEASFAPEKSFAPPTTANRHPVYTSLNGSHVGPTSKSSPAAKRRGTRSSPTEAADAP